MNQNGMNQGYPPAQGGQFQGSYDGYRPGSAAGYNSPAGYQPQQGYTAPQAAYNTGLPQGYAQDPQAAPYAGAPVNAGAPYGAPGGYNLPPQGGSGGSYIPQTPYSPGYTSPGYQASQNGYQAPQAGNGGSYIPQTPYSPGYTSPGYQPPQGGYQAPQGGYQPGYNPYGQMGRAPQMPQDPAATNSIPLNGGGYVPQRVPVRKRPFAIQDWHLIAAGALLAVLFAVGVLVTRSVPLKILLMVLAAGSTALLWVRPMGVDPNKRLTYSIVAAALCVLTAASFLLKAPADTTNTPEKTNGGSVAASSGETGGVPEIPAENGFIAATAPPEVTPEPQTRDNSLMERLVTFFQYWSGNRQDEMLALCAPSWQNKQENPRTSLFGLLANRTPQDCTPENITGTDADTSRQVTLTSTMDRHNGKDPEKYRMTVLMLKEGEEWYVDPQSLQSFVAEETPDPNVTPTPAVTATPAVYSNTVLYYNPSGGEYYHLDPSCRIINSKFTPLQGQFTFAELGNDPYNKLKPCNVCGAPLPES